MAEDLASQAAEAVADLEAVEAVEVEQLEEESWALLHLDSRLEVEGSEEGPDQEQLVEVKQEFCQKLEEELSRSKMGDLTQQGEDRADNQASASGSAGSSSAGSEALKWVRAQNDKLGLGIDKGVEYPVAAMRVLGIRTTQSCEGHTEHGLPYPWIDVEKEDIPKLEQALLEHPLPGFGIEYGRRLMPEEAQGYNSFSLQSQMNPYAKAELNPKVRDQLLSQMSGKRDQLQAWAGRVLS